MHLPAGYRNVREYFHDTMQFLYDYQWIYRYPMTGLLVHDVLSYIPAEWRVILEHMSPTELTMISNGCVQEQWPVSLIRFLDKCKHLQLTDKVHTEEWKLSQELRRGLSPKKQHEVSRMASLVHEECQKHGIYKVLDIGSGLGYLDLAVHLDLGYHVVGLESNDAVTATASQKASSLCDNCEAISFYSCKVSSSSCTDILHIMEKRLLNEINPCSCRKQANNVHEVQKIPSSSVCLVGLHTCGDLSASAADLFLQTSQLKLMVLVPCCYHKIATIQQEHNEDIKSNNFENFPSSDALTDILKERFDGYEEYLGRPFLRLASQESSSRWHNWTKEQHRKHSENLMARAVLDLAAHKMGLTLQKKHRRCVRKSQQSSFETFLEDAIERYDFVLSDGGIVTNVMREEILEEIQSLWLHFHQFCNLAEALTGLQAAMQASVESIVLIDRMTHLLEQQPDLTLDIVKVMDEKLSPRCRAMIVRKLT